MDIRTGAVRGAAVSAFMGLLPPSVVHRSAQPGYLLYGALADGAACGVVCAHTSEGSLELDYLYVAPDYRRQGVATALLAGLMEWAMGHFAGIHASFLPQAEEYETTPLARTLMGVGFWVEQSEDGFYTLPLSGVAVQAGDEPPDGRVVPLGEVPTPLLRSFAVSLRQNPPDGMPTAFPGNALPEVSMAYIWQNEVAGVLLAEERGPALAVTWLHARKMDGLLSAKALWPMLKAAVQAAGQHYPADTQVQIATVSAHAEKLVQRLCPGATRVAIVDAMLPLGHGEEKD